jgi:4'-phosphopantetheinyl transferase
MALDPDQRVGAFFDCWTQKEAYIKAKGGGLSIPLNQFDVALGPGVPAALLATRDDPDEVKRWSLYSVAAGDDYRAAVAVQGAAHCLLHWDFDRPRSPSLIR